MKYGIFRWIPAFGRLAVVCLCAGAQAAEPAAKTVTSATGRSTGQAVRQPDRSASLGAAGLARELKKGAPFAANPSERERLGQSQAAAAGSLELLQAVRMAVDWHPSISDALATLSQQAGGIDVARAGYYPQIRAGVGAGRQNSQDTGQTASITASQMLYDFGKVGSSVDAAEAGMRRQQALVLRQIDDVAKQTAQAVVGVHRYQVLQKIAQEQVTAIRRVMETAKLRAQAGISTQSDPLQARTRLPPAGSAPAGDLTGC